jgi:Anti-sigma-28 factor, FlgM
MTGRGSGVDPIIAAAAGDDHVPMTVLELRHPSSLRAPNTRFGRARTMPAMPEAPQTRVDELRAQVQRGAYTVDAGKVAEAIVARLLAGSSGRDRAG